MSLFLERVKISLSVWEQQRQGDDRCRHILVEDCYTDLFLTNVVSTFRAPLSTSASQPGPLPPHYRWHRTWFLLWLGCDSNWLTLTPMTNHLTWVYNFITPTCSSGSWFTWPASTFQPMWVVLLFTQLEHPVPEIHDWQLCQRSICNRGLKYEYKF